MFHAHPAVHRGGRSVWSADHSRRKCCELTSLDRRQVEGSTGAKISSIFFSFWDTGPAGTDKHRVTANIARIQRRAFKNRFVIRWFLLHIIYTKTCYLHYNGLSPNQRCNSHPGSPGAPEGPRVLGAPARGKEKIFLFTFRLVIKRIKNIKILISGVVDKAIKNGAFIAKK